MIKIILASDDVKQQLSLSHDAFVAFDGVGILGYCEFSINIDELYIHSVVCEEMPLLDGLFRQTMNYSLNNGAETMRYCEKVSNLLFMLKIIPREDCQSLDILDFFLKLNCGG